MVRRHEELSFSILSFCFSLCIDRLPFWYRDQNPDRKHLQGLPAALSCVCVILEGMLRVARRMGLEGCSSWVSSHWSELCASPFSTLLDITRILIGGRGTSQTYEMPRSYEDLAEGSMAPAVVPGLQLLPLKNAASA